MGFLAINFNGLKTVDRLLLSSLAVGLFLNSFSLLVFGQTGNSSVQKKLPSSPATQAETSGPRPNADETFELNIEERHYSQESFEAATAVGTKNADSLNLQIGVTLVSGRIDVLLRNVRGSVRFRGTLDRILEIISNREAAPPRAPSAVSPAPSP